MHLQALRYLVAVVDEGHFGRAAARMHVSQPSVSQAVVRLEQQFGVKLLDRSGSRVVATAEGERVLVGIRAALAHLDQALEAATTSTGPLRIGCTPFFSMWVTVELLTPFREAYPEIEVSVAELSVPAQAQALLAGGIDLAAGEPLGPDPRLRETTLREDHCAIWMSTDHPLTALDEVPLAALAGVPVADGNPELHPAYSTWIRALFAGAGVTPTFAPPAGDSPSAISRIIDGSTVSVAADIMPEGRIPGVAVRRLADPGRWRWVATEARDGGTRAGATFAAWAVGDGALR